MATPLHDARVHADALTEVQRADLRALLAAELDAQRTMLVEHRVEADALIGHNDVDSIAERELLDVAANRALEAIADVELALERLDDGRYGRCDACGAEIAFERLEVLPHTRHCVACPRPPSFLR